MNSDKNSQSYHLSSTDDKEEELVDNLSFYVSESSKTVISIKQSVYDLVNIAITTSSPRRSFENMAAIVSGSRRNLDDLKRIDSMLKGFLNSRRSNKVSEDEEEDEAENNSEQLNYMEKLKEGLQRGENKTQTLADNEELKFHLSQIQKLKRENNDLKVEVEQLQEKLRGLLSQKEIHESKDETVLNGEKKGKIQQCKSQIWETGKNLKEISSRNKECLNLIRKLRLAIDQSSSDEDDEAKEKQND